MSSIETLAAAVACALAVGGVVARGITVPNVRSLPTDGASTIRSRRWRWRPRWVEPTPDDVAAWCDALARALRSGSSLQRAVVDGAELESAMAPLVAPAARRVSRGEPLVAALDSLPIDASTAAGLAITVLRSAARFGGPAAAPLERGAATLRARAAVLAEQQAHSAQARLSAQVLTLVPIALLALLVAADPKVRAAVASPAGLGAVAAGVGLNATGSWWMRRIIGRPT